MPRHALLVLVAASAVAAGGTPAAAQQPDQQTVTAIGVGSARVRPADRRDNNSIRRTVARAVKLALPRAVAAARRDAETLAAGTGLVLGDVVAIAETAPSPFGGPFSETEGTFGPGRYCGKIRRSVLRRINGVRRRVIRSRRVCAFPSLVTSSVTVTYTARPAQ